MRYTYRRLKKDDEQSIPLLLKTNFSLFKNRDYWIWKYKNNPDFENSLVMVAEKDEEIVGCNHWLARELKISTNIIIKSALAGDLLVHPNHRGCGIAAELLRAMRITNAANSNGLSLAYMFAPLKLNNRLYEPVAGYIAAPNSTCTYRRMFNCKELRTKITSLNSKIQKKADLKLGLQRLNLTVLFQIAGSPPFYLSFKPEGISLEGDSNNVRPDLIIEGSIPLSSAILEGTISSKQLIASFLTRKIKVTKGLTKVLTLRKGMEILKKATL